MKYQNIVVYLVITLALLSIPSLLENVQAQTNSTNQSIPSQQNQNMNITVQALMKTDIFEIKDTLEKAKLAIIEGNLKEALTGIRDVETELLLIEPSPTKFLSNIHKTISAIAKSNIDKSLDSLTNVQVTVLKAENQIFKAAVANPQVMQQFTNMETTINEEDSTDIEEDSNDIEEDSTDIEEDSKDIEEDSNDIEEDSKDARQQFNTIETIIDEKEYYTDIEGR
jgi:hypothetical protein